MPCLVVEDPTLSYSEFFLIDDIDNLVAMSLSC
jgi:hypothetical protein